MNKKSNAKGYWWCDWGGGYWDDATVYDEYGALVCNDTQYYPIAPSPMDMVLICDAVNALRGHKAPKQKVPVKEDV